MNLEGQPLKTVFVYVFWYHLRCLSRMWVFLSGHYDDCTMIAADLLNKWSCRQQINQISHRCHCRPFCLWTVCLRRSDTDAQGEECCISACLTRKRFLLVTRWLAGAACGGGNTQSSQFLSESAGFFIIIIQGPSLDCVDSVIWIGKTCWCQPSRMIKPRTLHQ